MFFIGAGAADFHTRAALGVEEKRGAPAVEEFAGGTIDREVIGGDEGELKFVIAGQDRGDFGVGADGIAAAGEVGAKGLEDFAHDAEVVTDILGRGVEQIGEGAAFGGRRGSGRRSSGSRGRRRGGGGRDLRLRI